MTDAEKLAAWRKVMRMILDAPESAGGEIVYHADGGVTENRWSAKVAAVAPEERAT